MTPYMSRGPVETAAVAMLPDAVAVRCAPKSPLGPRALRVDGEISADWLRAQPWVGGVHQRPFGAYVAPTTAALYDWVVTTFAPGSEPGRGNEGDGLTVDVRAAPPTPPTPPAQRQRLDDRRAAAAAAAARRLLAARGFTVAAGGDVEVLATGPVDVPNGPLRARLGGFVYPTDLTEEIARRLRLDETQAGALLRYALLRHERSSSVTIDERAVYGPTAEAFATLTRDRGAAGAPLRDSRALRALLLHLDMMPSVVARSATARDAAFLVRFLDTLADRLRATPQRPAAVQAAVDVVVERAFALAHLDGPMT
jgi:hypothetical protein